MIDKNTRLLAICCSFRRPWMLKDMLKTFEETRSPGTELFIYLHLDDPRLEDYRSFIGDYNHEIGRHFCLQEVLNYAVFEKYPEIPYYQVICDDHLYRTPKWDDMLVAGLEKTKGWGFACARDLVNNDHWEKAEHPSAEIFSWKQASTLGYAYPRNFRQIGMDYFAKDLGKALNALTLVPEAIIEHLWYNGSPLPKDDNLKENYTPENIVAGLAQYREWVEKERTAALDKINAVRKHEQKA